MNKHGIEQLPESLGHAISLSSESTIVKDILGEHIFKNIIHVKQKEWEEYRKQITKWETDYYMPIL